MAESRKTKRSNSTRIMGMIETTLKLPAKLERRLSGEEKVSVASGEADYSEDSETPDVLPILRGSRLKHAKSDELPAGGRLISTEGMMKYEDMLSLLRCGLCNELSIPPLIQCRKGHIYCLSCKAEKKSLQCSTCKQTFVDAPNLALDRMVRLIAVPCKYGSRGCPEFVFLDTRLQHETPCRYRPISCQNERHGCNAIFSVKDMCWHHRMCPYANYPHPNVLPSMPARKKSTRRSDAHSPTPSASSDKVNGGNGCASEPNGGSSSINGRLVSGGDEPAQEGTATAAAAAIAAAAAKMLEDSTTQTEIKLFPGILSRKGAHD